MTGPMPASSSASTSTQTFCEFAGHVDYSLIETLHPDPESTATGDDHLARQVTSGHYVPVTPTPLAEPQYVAHSDSLFSELGLSHELVADESFLRLFSGDISVARAPMRPYGWATGYALSIYGTEYDQQCPFGNGNGYGDGRAASRLSVNELQSWLGGAVDAMRWACRFSRTRRCRLVIQLDSAVAVSVLRDRRSSRGWFARNRAVPLRTPAAARSPRRTARRP